MSSKAITALAASLSPHVRLGKTRLETLCLLIIGMIRARTVNLIHALPGKRCLHRQEGACERSGEVLIASTYRRLQRFFQHVVLGEDWSARLVIRLLGLPGHGIFALIGPTGKSAGGRSIS